MAGGQISQLLAEAQQAQQLGDFDRACALLESVIAIEAGHPVARNALGLFALERGAAKEAVGHFETACESDPQASQLWMNLARAHRESGDPAAERDALEKALDLDQRDLMALIRLAELH